MSNPGKVRGGRWPGRTSAAPSVRTASVLTTASAAPIPKEIFICRSIVTARTHTHPVRDSHEGERRTT